MLLTCLLISSLSILGGCAHAQAALHEFEDVSIWQPNKDGGNAPAISADRDLARSGAAMRLKYTDAPPHWGNLTGPCSVPPDARALRLWVYKHSASVGGVMHIWLFEPDGDGWLQRVRFDGKDLAGTSPGWHEARLPVVGFSFQARGDNTREMTKVDRMLIGCNYGDFEVTVDTMTWETGPSGELIPLPKTDGLSIQDGTRSFGILDMGDNLPGEFKPAHTPAALADALRQSGFGATILKAGDLADATVLTTDNFDAVLLPSGEFFPAEARDAFLAYLKSGGSFLSTDGYAFDSLVVLTEGGWSQVGAEVTAAEMNQPAPEVGGNRINTRIGKAGDALTLAPEQIGVFDPQFPLEHADMFRPASVYANPYAGAEGFARDTWAREHLPTYEFDGTVEGFSACGLIGVNSPVFPPVYRRWIPVLEAFEKDSGALRGTALSIMHNFSGEYEGSSWAFTGITSGQDIFLGDEKRRELLTRVLTDITEKVYLHSLQSDFATYEVGESATLSVAVVNKGKLAADRKLSIGVGDGTVLEQEIQLAPGESKTVQVTVEIDELAPHYDLVPVQASLIEGERISDTMKTAFCIRNETVLASGPRFAWSDNYMTVDGRPTFMVGTNQTGMMYFSANENPLVWDRDFATMNASNFHIWRILHFSPYSKGGYEGRPTNQPLDLVNRPKKLVRQMDAIVQLAQKHRVAIFLALHDWMGTVLTDEELAVQADWNRFWVERYKDVPGVFYDVQNEPSVNLVDQPYVVELWNEFLKQRYGTDEVLRAAWDKNPPEAAMPNVPLGETTEDWYDVRSADRKRFETELLNRWVKANVDPVHDADPDTPICVGYLPSMPPADKILGVKHTDFSNMHYYGAPERMPLETKLIDRRFQGKGFSLGEFGAREAHDARANGQFGVPVEPSVYRFHTYIHYAAGMGAAFIANWDWKDFDESVFPWGLIHHCSYVSKPWLQTLTQGSILLSLAEPKYESPEVFLLAPDSNRVGPHFGQLHTALQQSVDLLLDQRVNFGVINEEDLADLPASAKAIYWPLPYCPSDAAFDTVLNWVKAGGTLYLSGDIAFDSARKPERLERREALGLPEMKPVSPFETPEERWNLPPMQVQVGSGKVVFAPYPLELKAQGDDAEVYRSVLEAAGLSPIALEPAGAPVRVVSIPTTDGGRLYSLARKTAGDDLLAVSLPDVGVTVELASQGYAFVLVGSGGAVLAAESQGAVRVGDQEIARAQDHFAVCSLDAKDLRETRQLLVLPHLSRDVSLAGISSLQGANCYYGPPAGELVRRPGSEAPDLTFPQGALGQVAVIAAENDLSAATRVLRDHVELRFR